METLDLNKRLAADHHLEVKVSKTESDSERDSRLRREEAQAAHERWKGTIGFGALVLAAFGIGGIAAYMLLSKTSSADDRKWAASILTALFTEPSAS